MITFSEFLFMMEYDLKPVNYFKSGALIPKGGSGKINPMKAVNPARPHRYQAVFLPGSKKGRLSKKSSNIIGR